MTGNVRMSMSANVSTVRGWYLARRQYKSLCEGAVVSILDSVDIEDGVPGKVQVECGREEEHNGE